MALLDSLLASGAAPSDLGWLYGAMAPVPQEDAATLAARMRQQSPTVPPPEGWPTAGGDSSFGSLSPGTINDATWQNPNVNLPPIGPGGIGSDYAASGGMPAPIAPPDWSRVEGTPAWAARQAQPAANLPAQSAPSASVPPLPPPVNVPALRGGPNDPRAAMAAAPPAGPGLAPPAPAAAQQQPPAAQPTSLLGRIGNGINNNSNLLLALGAGLAGAPSIGTGIQRALTQAQPVAQQNQTVQALMGRGMPQDMAQLAASNPQALNTILPRLLGAKQWQMGEKTDLFGQKVPFLYDPVSGETKALDFGGGQGRATPGMAAQTLGNFDLNKIDPNLKGMDYLNQWPQEVQAATKAFMNGGVMPTGNPRNNNISSIAKTVAQKVASDLDQPQLADDTRYPQRREMAVNLTKSAPGSIGGQITFAGTALGHLGSVAEKAADLNNSNGLGVAPIARVINWGRQLSTDNADKANAASGAIQHYGQEITKFYTGSPGGEAERMRFLNTMDTAKSPKEIAGAIRTERDLVPERVDQIYGQIKDALGEDVAKQWSARANIPAAVNRINQQLARLDPDGPEAKAMKGQPQSQGAQTTQTRQPVRTATNPQTGQKLADYGDENWVPLQ